MRTIDLSKENPQPVTCSISNFRIEFVTRAFLSTTSRSLLIGALPLVLLICRSSIGIGPRGQLRARVLRWILPLFVSSLSLFLIVCLQAFRCCLNSMRGEKICIGIRRRNNDRTQDASYVGIVALPGFSLCVSCGFYRRTMKKKRTRRKRERRANENRKKNKHRRSRDATREKDRLDYSAMLAL